MTTIINKYEKTSIDVEYNPEFEDYLADLTYHHHFDEFENYVNKNIELYPHILDNCISITNFPDLCLVYWEYHKDTNRIKVDTNMYNIHKELKIQYVDELPNNDKNITKYNEYQYHEFKKCNIPAKTLYDNYKKNTNLKQFFSQPTYSPDRTDKNRVLLKYLLDNKLYDEFIKTINIIMQISDEDFIDNKFDIINFLLKCCELNKEKYHFDVIEYMFSIKN
jgi:hypothetical protein